MLNHQLLDASVRQQSLNNYFTLQMFNWDFENDSLTN